MRLFSGKKVLKYKIRYYVGNKISELKDKISENKTLITCALLGGTYYLYKLYFNA